MHDCNAGITLWNAGQLLPGLAQLRRQTSGHHGVKVAVLDSQIAASHPFLQHQNLPDAARPAEHGSHIASVIGGECHWPQSPYSGIAPHIQLLSFPVYQTDEQGQSQPCGQQQLANAIHHACDAGCHIINISGGELTRIPAMPGVLADAVNRAGDEQRLIVAAAGNDGIEAIHTPASLPGVLAVGAANWDSQPLGFSNFGQHYQQNAVLAPGLDIPGAGFDTLVTYKTGTSFATPIVCGIAALLLSCQAQANLPLTPLALRALIINTAQSALPSEGLAQKRVMAGRINLEKLLSVFNATLIPTPNSEDNTMSDIITSTPAPEANGTSVPATQPAPNANMAAPAPAYVAPMQVQAQAQPHYAQPAPAVAPSATVINPHSAGNPRDPRQPVYCLGSLGFDWQIEARQDFFLQLLSEYMEGSLDERMFRYIVENNDWENAELLTWVVKIDGTPTYAIKPDGAGTLELYKLLVSCLYYQLPPDKRPNIPDTFKTQPQRQIEAKYQLTGKIDTDIIHNKNQFDYMIYTQEALQLYKLGQMSHLLVDCVAIAGVVVGETVLYNGSKVPLLEVSLSGVRPWDKSVLVAQALDNANQNQQLDTYIKNRTNCDNCDQQKAELKSTVHDCIDRALDKIYFELKNNGISEHERAINYVGTNILNLADIFVDIFELIEENGKVNSKYELDTVFVEASKVQRPTSILMDVILRFFQPNDQDKAFKCYRFTVDVSDVNPVMVEGKPKIYFESNFRNRR
ncbi:MAG: cyanobactin maturation PatA/PatG family protease [Phenylobacterium sp.]|jgi:cyanobactin maturation PatA/PatG family protease